MGCGGSTAKGEEKPKSDKGETKGNAEKPPAEKKEGTATQNGDRQSTDKHNPGSAQKYTVEENTSKERVDESGGKAPEAEPKTPVYNEESKESLKDAKDDVKEDTVPLTDQATGRSPSGGGTLTKRLSQSTNATAATSVGPTTEGEEDPEENIMKLIQQLRDQAIAEARRVGATKAKANGVLLSSIGGPVELSPKDLVRIRHWADFRPSFDPIPALEVHDPPKQLRESTLRMNQDMLDTYERGKSKAQSAKDPSSPPQKLRDVRSQEPVRTNMADRDRSNKEEASSPAGQGLLGAEALSPYSSKQSGPA